MPQLFPERANRTLAVALVTGAALALVVPAAVWAFARTPAATGQYSTAVQPVPFSHPLHVNGLGVDCRYCHAGVERAASAGLPPTSACVPCHLDSMLETPMFGAVRESLRTERPLAWRRVTSLPDFVFFNHAVHVRNGIECVRCHGAVELMPQVYQAMPLTMEWCVECHRDPAQQLSIRPARVDGWWTVDVERSREQAARYDVQRLTSCTACHR